MKVETYACDKCRKEGQHLMKNEVVTIKVAIGEDTDPCDGNYNRHEDFHLCFEHAQKILQGFIEALGDWEGQRAFARIHKLI